MRRRKKMLENLSMFVLSWLIKTMRFLVMKKIEKNQKINGRWKKLINFQLQ